MIAGRVQSYEAVIKAVPVAGFTSAEEEKPTSTIEVVREPVYTITEVEE
jgi:hypothetical protein